MKIVLDPLMDASQGIKNTPKNLKKKLNVLTNIRLILICKGLFVPHWKAYNLLKNYEPTHVRTAEMKSKPKM